jgi:hypothetical protein
MNKIARGLLLLSTTALGVSAARAATFSVSSTADAPDADLADGVCDDGTGTCTLRAAIEQSNAAADPDEVILGEATYLLTRGPLLVTSAVRIRGQGPTRSIISAGNASGVLSITLVGRSVRVRVTNLALTGGNAFDGGGLRIEGGRVKLDHCVVSDNVGDVGGGIAIRSGRVTILDCAVRNNRAGLDWGGGGGVFAGPLGRAGAHVHIKDSVISGNLATAGGGIQVLGGNMTIIRTIIERNRATDYVGGGISNHLGLLTIHGSSITYNQGVEGGGLYNAALPTIVRDSHVENNTASAGGGIFSDTFIWLPGTVVSGNSPDQCAGDGTIQPPCP